MKNIIYLFITALLVFSCGEEELVTFNGQTAVSFTSTFLSTSVPVEGVTVTLPVSITTTDSSARNFTVSVDDEASSGTSADYTLGSVTIPANSYDGELSVTFNFAPLPELVANTLVLKLDPPAGGAAYNDVATIEYFKAVICNDMVLTINEDGFGSERDWDIKDSNGNIVESCASHGCPFGNVSGGETNVAMFTLPDGCYTFTIYDSYGDGLFDGNVTGSYALTCSIITHAAGSGNFGSEESTDFCVNQ